MKKIIVALLLIFALFIVASAKDKLDMTDAQNITEELLLSGDAVLYKDGESVVIKLTGDNPVSASGLAVLAGDLPKNFDLTFEYKVAEDASLKPNARGILVGIFARQIGEEFSDPMFLKGSGAIGFELDLDCYDKDRSTMYMRKWSERASWLIASRAEYLRTPYEEKEWHKVEISVGPIGSGCYVDGIEFTSGLDYGMTKTGTQLFIAGQNGDEGESEEILIRNVLLKKGEAISASASWATPELLEAAELGLIPDMLWGADMTKPITRLQFAALSVELYEKMSGKTAEIVNTPFYDCAHPAVAKAYGLGITGGVEEHKFAPDEVISREQVATMLARVFKAAFPDIKISGEGVKKFADHDKISDWARDSVYFMVSRGIINGIGDNKFAPRNTTPAETAAGYANSTAEQAIIIAKRSFDKK